MLRLMIFILTTAISTNAFAGSSREAVLRHHLEETLAADPSLPSIIAEVDAPQIHLHWSGAVGRGEYRTIHTNQRFRIASVTKTFTAAATLRLVEEGRLHLNDAIGTFISPETAEELRRGGYEPRVITIQELLTHTSGLFDYASSPEYFASVQSDPHKRWSRAEQIAFAVQHGHPVGMPGERFAYSDTGYVILGEIVERLTGESLPASIRRLVGFERLGLHDTYFESLEVQPAPPQVLATQLYQTINMTQADPSFDLYGGGGLVSTVADMVRFIRPLVQGKIFAREGTLAVALSTPPVLHEPKETPHANLLVQTPLGQDLCWGHGGFWGIAMIYCPEADVAIALTINQADPQSPTVLKLATLLMNSTKEAPGETLPGTQRSSIHRRIHDGI